MNRFSSVRELYEYWGFVEKPFQTYEAESEDPALIDFFLEPAWIDEITDESASRSVALFGPRGMGKTAIRLYVEAKAAQKRLTTRGPILVPYVDFSHLDGSEEAFSAQRKHTHQLVRLMLAFGLLHRHELERQQADLPMLDEPIADLLHRYFRSRDDASDILEANKDFVLSAPSDDVLESYAQTLREAYPWYVFRPVRRFARTHWGTLTHAVGEAIKQIRGVEAQLLPPEVMEKGERRVRRDLHLLARSAEKFGGTSWWILVDRLDEHCRRMCGEEAEAKGVAARLATSLMVDTRLLLETEGVHFKFFLWSDLRESLRKNDVRLDRVRNWSVEWGAEDLRRMMDRRMAHYSKNKVSRLQELCDSGDGEAILRTVIRLADGSPRQLRQLLDAMITEHLDDCRRQDCDPARMTIQSCLPGLSECGGRLAKDRYGDRVVDRIIQLGESFRVKQVSEQLRLEDPQRHLADWQGWGAVRRTGVGEGPDEELQVTDPLLLWQIDRNLILEAE